MSSWQVVLLEPARTVLAQISQFLVNLLLVIIIILIGWLVAKALKSVVSKVLKALRLDDLSERIELNKVLEKGGIVYSFSELVGVICYWLGLLITFMIAINAVGLTIAADLLNKVLLYIPHVVAAVFILILGMFIATLLKNVIQTMANNAGLGQGKLLAKIVETIVIVFSVFVGLEQLQVGLFTTGVTLAIILGSVGLGLALAFGLGCKDIAGRFVADLAEKLKKK